MLYSFAEVFVYPSLSEGFGLPVVEAMACGAPVVTSNCSSLPEVAGTAALLVDPTDPDAIGEAIARVVSDEATREDLRARSLARAREFSWTRTAAQTFDPVPTGGRGMTDGRPPLHACTIVSKNHLSYARVLARSFLDHHPGGRFFVLLVDRIDGYVDAAAEPFELIEVEALENIADIKALLFKYTVLEANTAVKPFFLEQLFAAEGLERLIYLDPDILVLRPARSSAGRLGAERDRVDAAPDGPDRRRRVSRRTGGSCVRVRTTSGLSASRSAARSTSS